jgi:pyrroline-5-carboxylate reductase
MLAKKLGILGTGNMGTAFIRGVCSKQLIAPENIFIFDLDESKMTPLQSQYGIQLAKDETDLISKVDFFIIALKPQVIPEVLSRVGSVVRESQTIISIAAGVTISTLKKLTPKAKTIIRVMPNTPGMIGAGISAFCSDEPLSKETKRITETILGALGEVLEVNEKLIDAVTGLSGSGPAYMFLIIDALADGGVKMGLSKTQALKLATHTMLGAAKMVVELNKQPSELKDMVTSPGGTTIAGLHALELGKIRATLMNAVEAATLRSRELGK